MSVKYSKMAINIPILSNIRASKIYLDWDFLFENKPSGNPVQNPGTSTYLVYF
jgi:hypothetical protein